MSDKVFVCPKCEITFQRKGKCDQCKSKLIELDKYLEGKEKMTLEKIFAKNLKKATKEGFDNIKINRLAGCSERKLLLTEAEGEAAKRTYQQFMSGKLWNDPEIDAEPGWLFGSSLISLNIGLAPSKLAKQRLGLNSNNRHLYLPINQVKRDNCNGCN